MDIKLVKKLIELNTSFYASNAESFFASRSRPWQGWDRLAPFIQNNYGNSDSFSVIDFASGNGRFEAWLESKVDVPFTCCLVDNCNYLVDKPLRQKSKYEAVNLDLFSFFLNEQANLYDCFSGFGKYDMAVSFGFMHHIPRFELRRRFMLMMYQSIKDDGYMVLSFWQFLNDIDFANKAQISNANAIKDLSFESFVDEFEKGDCFLGWKNTSGAYRYCHHFDNSEIDKLICCLNSYKIEDIYNADGRDCKSNCYVVIRKLKA